MCMIVVVMIMSMDVIMIVLMSMIVMRMRMVMIVPVMVPVLMGYRFDSNGRSGIAATGSTHSGLFFLLFLLVHIIASLAVITICAAKNYLIPDYDCFRCLL